MKIIEKIDDKYFVKICPRTCTQITLAKVRSKVSNTVQSIDISTEIHNNVITVQLHDFEPKQDIIYELYLINESDFNTVWFGQIMYTTQNVQNYQFGK